MAQWRKVIVSGSDAQLNTVQVGGGSGGTGATLSAAGAITADAAVTAGTSFIIGSADINETDLEKIEGITNGAGAANKALVLDASADIASGLRNITITGTFSDGNYTFDTSGNVSGLGTVGCGAITATGTSTFATAASPDAVAGATLGSAGAEWGHIFIADDSKIQFGNDQDVTIEYDEDGTDELRFSGNAVTFEQAVTFDGAVTLGNATGDDINNTGRWVGDFVPKTDSSIDLGTSTLQFAEAHIDTGHIDAITVTGTSTLTTVDINGGNIDGTVIGAASALAGTFTTLSSTGLTTLGDASGDTVTINAATINPANIAAGTDNSVVVYNGSTLVTDEIDSRVWGSTLVDTDGSGANNELATWSDSDSIIGEGNLTFDGSTLAVTGNQTISGDLTVNGTTTTLATTNLAVQDAFIFAATGSATANVDAGLIVQSGSAVDSGSAIYNDISSQRWAVAKGIGSIAAAVTPLQMVVTTVVSASSPHSSYGEYGVGEMWVETDSQDIWIRTS